MPAASADIIFTEDFNSYTSGNPSYVQGDTGFTVEYGGTVAGWDNSGGNAVHGVEVAPGDWAVMLINDNILTLSSGISGSNTNGTGYALNFDYGTANFAGDGNATTADSSLEVEILRSDNSVLASGNFAPGAWASGNYDLQQGLTGTINYTGDGSGDLRIEIFAETDGAFTGGAYNGIFGGSIDNISLETTPEPSALSSAALGLFCLAGVAIWRRRLNRELSSLGYPVTHARHHART